MLSSQQQETATWITGVILTVSTIMALAYFVPSLAGDPLPSISRKANPSSRAPASSKENKLGQPAGDSVAGRGPQGKGSPHFSITFNNSDSEPLKKGANFSVTAEIEARVDLEGYEYVWLLPEGITATGETKGYLSRIPAGEIANLQLSARTETNDNRQIHLHVFRMVNGEASGQTVQYNTVNQVKINAGIERKAQALKALQAKEGKAVKLMQ